MIYYTRTQESTYLPLPLVKRTLLSPPRAKKPPQSILCSSPQHTFCFTLRYTGKTKRGEGGQREPLRDVHFPGRLSIFCSPKVLSGGCGAGCRGFSIFTCSLHQKAHYQEGQHLDFSQPTPIGISPRNSSGESISYMRHLNSPHKHCLQKLINVCMIDGQKHKSYVIISNTLNRLANYGDVVKFIISAIENVKPILEVKKVRISGTTQLVPSIISKDRQETLAIRWIMEAAIKRRNTNKNLSLDQCLSAEIVDASRKTGIVRKRRDDLHKLAEANRGFSHYRWW